MIRRSRWSTPLALALAAILAACGDATSAAPGTVSLLLTDAPGDFRTAVVTISQVYLQGSDEEGDGGRVVLMDAPVTTDLLTLANDTRTLVEDVTVPGGQYAQLRFVITGAYIEVENADGGTSIYATSPDYEGLPEGAVVAGALQMPSYRQTGLKVNLPGGALEVEGDQHVLLVDFDVSRSFGQQAGASGMWVMTPVVEATRFELTGGLSTTLAAAQDVTLPTASGEPVTLGDFSATLTRVETGSAETLPFVEENGVFRAGFRFLVPGDYTVQVVGPEGVTFTTDPAGAVTVPVGSAAVATRAFTITSATAP